MTRVPLGSPPPFTPPRGPKLTLVLRTITPMFGGGPEERKIAEHGPVRAASVRGCLRFWWRATAGASAEGSQELFQREEDLWGSTSVPGKVGICIENICKGEECKPSDFHPPKPTKTGPRESYFLFPFQEIKEKKTPEAIGRQKVTFRLILTLNVPKESQKVVMWEVVQSLSAWLMLGGVGARTRRGLGALEVVECTDSLHSHLLPPADPNTLRTWLEQRTTPFSHRCSWTTWSGFYVLGEPMSASEAWRELGVFWSRFRKGHDDETSPMEGGKWPDHHTLRTLPHDVKDVVLGKPALGLPIIYQNFPQKGNIPASFVGTIEATEEKRTRLASPIILKPVFFADGKVRPLVALLNTPPLREVRLREQDRILTLQPLTSPIPQTTVVDARMAALQRAEAFFGGKIRRFHAKPGAAR